MLHNKCLGAVTKATGSENWTEGVRKLKVISLNKDQINDACLQVASYEADPDNFFEVIQVDFLTCPVIWSGASLTGNKTLTLLSFFPTRLLL